MKALAVFAAAVSITLSLAFSSLASAGTIVPGVYRLLDHGDGKLGTNYGLRVDFLSATFSMEIGGAEVLLTWDGGNSATLIGTIFNNSTGEIWELDYLLTPVTAVGTMGFTSTAGAGTITDPSNNITNFIGKADAGGDVFAFLADGHRISGDSDSPVGRGWLDFEGINDFLVRAEVVPEPGTGLLLSLGLLGLAVSGRRRKT